MPSYGRHRLNILFWPWSYNTFVTTTDIINCSITKSASRGQTARFTLFPRPVPYGTSNDGRILRDENTGYMDALGPNDWVFIWVDPGDGDDPEPIFMGFIDRVSYAVEVGDGGIEYAIDVSCTGFEKAFNNTLALTNPWLSDNIGIPNLAELQTFPGLGGAEGFAGFTATTPHVIDWLVQTFLVVDNQDSDQERIASEIQDTVESLLGENEGGRGAERQSNALRVIMGQFMLPRIGLPLWNFLVLRFGDIQQRAYLEPSIFLNQTNTPLIRLIDTFSNQLLNELIYDVRRISNPGTSDLSSTIIQEITGGFNEESVNDFVEAIRRVDDGLSGLARDVAPHMILRERPLLAEELNRLDGPTIPEEAFTEIDLGVSDSDLHNLTMIDTPSVHANSPARIMSGFPGFEEYPSETLYSIARHGIRMYNDTTAAWPAEAAAPTPDPSLVRDWELRLARAGLDNAKNWSGHASLPKYVRELFLGGKLIIQHKAHPGVTRNADRRIYYVDSIDYTYSASGQFTTGLGLVRGQVLQERGS